MPKEKKISKNLDRRFTVLLDPKVHERFEAHCAELKTTRSDRIRSLVDADLEAHESNNP